MTLRMSRFSGKRRLLAVSLAAVALLGVVAAVAFMSFRPKTALGSGTGPGGCISSDGPVCTFQGNTAMANFNTVSSDDGCIYTSASIQAYDNLLRPGNVTSQPVFIFTSKYDVCNDIPLQNASNMDPNTFLPQFTGTVTFDSSLQSATIIGTAPMFDYVTSSAFTGTINITFKGYGPTVNYSNNSHFRSAGYITSSHNTGSSRTAAASGTIADEAGNNFAATPSPDGTLADARGGSLQIFRPQA